MTRQRLANLAARRHRGQLNAIWRLLGGGLIGLLVVAATVSGGLALWFAFPAVDGLRAVLALGFVALGAGGLLAAVFRLRLVVPLLPFAASLIVLLAW